MPGFIDAVGDLAGLNLASQPQVTTVTVQTNAVKIANGDPKRVVLIISGNTSQAHTISNSSNVTNNNGIVLTQSNPLMIFTQWEHGPIVGLEWWAICTAVGANVMGILSVTVADWPNELPQNFIQLTDQGYFRANNDRRAVSRRVAKLYSDSWGKRQAEKANRVSHFLNSSVDF